MSRPPSGPGEHPEPASRRALVTGASGFIGRALCERLRRAGWRVRAVLRRPDRGPWDEAERVDLAGGPLPAGLLHGVHTVFHLAARTHAVDAPHGDEAAYRALNVEATRGLVRAAGAAGAACFVLFSSVKAMGEGGAECLDEESAAEPASAYGRTKLEAEGLVVAAAEAGGPRAVVLRLPLVYGPGVKGNLARMLDAVAAGRFPPLADPGNRRSLVHVADVCEAALLAAERAPAPARMYLVTDGEAYSTGRLYEAMARALGRVPARLRVPLWALRSGARVGDVVGRWSGRRMPLDSATCERLTGSAWYSAERIRRELGYAPRHTLESALPAMVEARRRLAYTAPGSGEPDPP
jgi:UDP-glucose 4-epimerase